MNTLRFGLVALPSVLALACGPARDGSDTESSASDLSSNGVDIGEHWHSAVRCDGAHVDVFDDGYSYYKQVVIDDAGAAAYLRGKLDDAVNDDPFTWQYKMTLGGALRSPSNPNQFILLYIDSSDTNRDFLFTSEVTTNNEIRADVHKYTWEANQGGNTYSRYTDMQVRLVRNGYQGYQCQPGVSGDPPTCGNTGDGWAEWEIANWTFRGCQ